VRWYRQEAIKRHAGKGTRVSEGVRVVAIPAPGRDGRFGGNVEAIQIFST
jgi:hypothetical protein